MTDSLNPLAHKPLQPLTAFGMVAAANKPILESRPVAKRTFQPHNKRRLRVHGFRARMATPGGRNVLRLRRSKGRHRIAVTTYQK